MKCFTNTVACYFSVKLFSLFTFTCSNFVQRLSLEGENQKPQPAIFLYDVRNTKIINALTLGMTSTVEVAMAAALAFSASSYVGSEVATL